VVRTDGTLAELLAVDGVEEELVLGSRFGFMAFHAGLEENTDDVAVAAAKQSGASLYVVRQPVDLLWHVPSHRFVAEESPRLAEFLDHVDAVVAVHGFGRPHLTRSLLLGGRGRRLAEHVAISLIKRLPHYEMVVRLDDIPRKLRGMHPDNPVNVSRVEGVQLELPPRVRGCLPDWAKGNWKGPGRQPQHQGLIDGLADAATAWGAAVG
jgi:phage replication-related protein YjqB (UPF0714/DUF867 family)